jgi:putative ABC transport system permease protein
MRSILQDLRYALRQLRKSPGFTFTAVTVLALGIGANIAVFTILNGILLRPLPYAHSDRIVTAGFVCPTCDFSMNYANMLQLRDAVGRDFQMGASFGDSNASITGPGGRVQVERTEVDSGLLPMLGIQPILGRAFRPEENEPGRNHVVLLGEDVWRKLYNSDPHIGGKTLAIRGETYTILGVMPRRFSFPFGDIMQIWSPAEIPQASRSAMADGASMNGEVYARLPDRMTLGQLTDQFNRAQSVIAKELPADSTWPTHIKVSGYQQMLNAEARKPLLLLYVVVFGIWLLACLNVTSLMLARAVARTREQAVRAAVGASRARLLQQAVVESLLLSTIGGVFGLLLGQTAIKLLWRQIQRRLPLTSAIHVDWRVVACVTALTLVTALVVGIFPALRATRRDVQARLHGVTTTASASQSPYARSIGRRTNSSYARLPCGCRAVSAHHSRAAHGSAGLYSAERADRRHHPKRLGAAGPQRPAWANQHREHIVFAAFGAAPRHSRRAGGRAQFSAAVAQRDESQDWRFSRSQRSAIFAGAAC